MNAPTAANCFQRAVALLQPFMSTERRDTWLTQAFYFDHRGLYDGIDQQGAPADFTVRCVRLLLDAGCRDGRHALSWLLGVVRSGCGDERQPEFTALIDELDRFCAQASAGDARSLELAYLYRLQLEELRYTELYTPLAGIARVVETHRQEHLPAVVMRPEFTHLTCRQERSETAPTETKRYDDIVIACADARRAVVLGEPGAGKTTALYKLAGTALETALADPTTPLPVLVRLGEWTAPAQPLPAFIAEKLGPLGGSFQTLLHQRRVLLLLDGLNEIPVSERDRKAAEIKTLLQAQRDLPAVVTCRELDYTGALNLGLDTLTIRPLNPLRIREFVITYLTAAIDPANSDPADRKATGATRGEDLFWKLAGGDEVREVWQVWQSAGADLTLFFTASKFPDRNAFRISWSQDIPRQP